MGTRARARSTVERKEGDAKTLVVTRITSPRRESTSGAGGIARVEFFALVKAHLAVGGLGADRDGEGGRRRETLGTDAGEIFPRMKLLRNRRVENLYDGEQESRAPPKRTIKSSCWMIADPRSFFARSAAAFVRFTRK